MIENNGILFCMNLSSVLSKFLALSNTWDVVNILSVILVALVGALVGVLINYLSDVLPTTRQLSQPTCPECQGAYRLKDYLLIWRCAHCGRRHSPRHAVVLVASVAACVALVFFPLAGLPWPAWIALLVFLGVIFVIDLEHRLVLFETSLVGLVVCFVYGWILQGFLPALLGGLGGLGIMLGFFLLGALFSRIVGLLRGRKVGEVAFGFGDVFAGTFLGLLMGWPLIMGAVTLGLLGFAAYSIVYLGVLLVTKRYQAFGNALPLVPFLILGAVVMLVLI